MHESPPERTRSGFNLIELLVVIALIGILIGLLLPHIRKIPLAYYQGKHQFEWMSRLHGQDASKHEEAVTALCYILLDARFRCRCVILDSLGRAGPRARNAIPTLEVMLRRECDQPLRADILRALEQIDPQGYRPAVPELRPWQFLTEGKPTWETPVRVSEQGQ